MRIFYWWRYLLTWIIITIKRVSKLLPISSYSDYQKFVIISSPRSGTTLLHTYLNSHLNILSLGEVLRGQLEKFGTFKSVDNFIFTPQPKLIQSMGFKMFYEQHEAPFFEDVFAEVVNDRSVKIIHLIRRDFKAQLQSLRQAWGSGEWSSTKVSLNVEENIIPEEDLMAYSEKQQEFIMTFRKVFSEHPYLELSYEELADNPDKTLLTVQKFIGVVPRKLFTLLKKQRRSH